MTPGNSGHAPGTPDRPPSFSWLYEFVRPHAAALGGIVGLSLAATGIGLAQPYITKFLIDDGLIARNFKAVAVFCGLLFAAAIVSTALAGANRWAYIKISARILFGIREAIYRHLQTLSPRWYARTPRGDLMARIDGDIAEVQRFAVDPLLALTNGVIALAGSLALMISLSGHLTLLAFALFPVQVLYLRKMRPAVEQRTRAVRERTGDLTGFFLDRFDTMKLIQSVGAQDREAGRLTALNQSYLRELLGLQLISFFTTAGPGLMTVAMTAVVFMVGGLMVVDETLTIGTLIAFSAYMARATGPVNTLLGLYVAAQRARVSLDRVRELTELKAEVTSSAEPSALPPTGNGSIDLIDVTFSYGPNDGQVLKGANFHIEGGAKVGIAGPSGGGKTTLIDLLMRHFDPDEGRVLLDGIDLRALDLHELRRRVSVVEQDATIVSGTIAENIAYARPNASRSEIEHAATAARIKDYIDGLPDGYDTLLEVGGGVMSGGQRQRIAIARALLQDPLILILDEATSSVDTETAVAIIQTVDTLFSDRTRIVVSHHEEPLADTDVVAELRNGQLHLLNSKRSATR